VTSIHHCHVSSLFHAGPLLEGCEPLLLISIFNFSTLIEANQEHSRANQLNSPHSFILAAPPFAPFLISTF